MTSRILILGAGLIGAGLAYELSCRRARVTVIEAALPAGGASGRSFGWINASFSLNPAHFRARLAAMALHRRWQGDLGFDGYRAQGCLWWEETGAAFDALARDLSGQGYPLREVSRAGIVQREPALRRPPPRALLFDAEASVDAADLTRHLLAAACARGAEVLQGCGAARVIHGPGGVSGVGTLQGLIAADQVILATGTGTPATLGDAGIGFAMLHRPGAILRTRPVALRINHILASPKQELRQDATGAIVAPAAELHQQSAEETLGRPDRMAQATLARLADLLGQELQFDSLTLAQRPVPGDGLPCVGAVPGVPGLYMAVLHSGVTLAPLVAASLARQVLGRAPLSELAGFSPDRLIRRAP